MADSGCVERRARLAGRSLEGDTCRDFEYFEGRTRRQSIAAFVAVGDDRVPGDRRPESEDDVARVRHRAFAPRAARRYVEGGGRRGRGAAPEREQRRQREGEKR